MQEYWCGLPFSRESDPNPVVTGNLSLVVVIIYCLSSKTPTDCRNIQKLKEEREKWAMPWMCLSTSDRRREGTHRRKIEDLAPPDPVGHHRGSESTAKRLSHRSSALETGPAKDQGQETQ